MGSRKVHFVSKYIHHLLLDNFHVRAECFWGRFHFLNKPPEIPAVRAPVWAVTMGIPEANLTKLEDLLHILDPLLGRPVHKPAQGLAG